MLHARIGRRENAVVGLGLTRSRQAGEFGTADFALVRRLAPHIRRSVSTYHRLAEALASRQVMAEALDYMRPGVLGLDMTGRIVFANRTAQSFLASGDTIRTEGGLIAANRPTEPPLCGI